METAFEALILIPSSSASLGGGFLTMDILTISFSFVWFLLLQSTRDFVSHWSVKWA